MMMVMVVVVVLYVCWLSRSHRSLEKGGESMKLSLQKLGEQADQRNNMVLQALSISSTPLASTIYMLLFPRSVPPVHALPLTSRSTYLTDHWITPLGNHTGHVTHCIQNQTRDLPSQTRSSFSLPYPSSILPRSHPCFVHFPHLLHSITKCY